VQLSANSPGSVLVSFFSAREFKPGLVIITGPSGAGKTRWCMKLIERARARGFHPAGLVSPAVFERGRKTGIDLQDLTSGERRRLATRKGESGGNLQTSDWQMIPETLTWGNSILENTGAFDLFILDELGPLEFEQGLGLVAGLDIVDSSKSFPAFISVRPSLLSMACRRWPWAQPMDLLAEVEA
jgi:nucleoside-triphosphatase THEP1